MEDIFLMIYKKSGNEENIEIALQSASDPGRNSHLTHCLVTGTTKCKEQPINLSLALKAQRFHRCWVRFGPSLIPEAIFSPMSNHEVNKCFSSLVRKFFVAFIGFCLISKEEVIFLALTTASPFFDLFFYSFPRSH